MVLYGIKKKKVNWRPQKKVFFIKPLQNTAMSLNQLLSNETKPWCNMRFNTAIIEGDVLIGGALTLQQNGEPITAGWVLTSDELGNASWAPGGGSAGGDVLGPAGATHNALAAYNDTSGKVIKNTAVTTTQTFNPNDGLSMAGTMFASQVNGDDGDITNMTTAALTAAQANIGTLHVSNGATVQSSLNVTSGGIQCTGPLTMVSGSQTWSTPGGVPYALNFVERLTLQASVSGPFTLSTSAYVFKMGPQVTMVWPSIRSPVTLTAQLALTVTMSALPAVYKPTLTSGMNWSMTCFTQASGLTQPTVFACIATITADGVLVFGPVIQGSFGQYQSIAWSGNTSGDQPDVPAGSITYLVPV
jgi:hypothetical protein